MKKYDALSSQQTAAELYWQLHLEAADIRATADYNAATEGNSSYTEGEWSAAYAFADKIVALAAALMEYAGVDEVENARVKYDDSTPKFRSEELK